MVAEPKLTPVTYAGLVGVVEPAGIRMLGVTVSFVGSLLVSVTVTSCTAGVGPTLTAIGSVWPGATVTPDCTVRLPCVREVMGAEPEVSPVALAVIVVGPPAVGPPVIVNVPVVLPPVMFTLVDDRVTNPVLFSESATFTPVLGAGEFSVIVPVTVFPTPTALELNVSVMVACPTLMVADAG